jgi:hypothetical protein
VTPSVLNPISCGNLICLSNKAAIIKKILIKGICKGYSHHKNAAAYKAHLNVAIYSFLFLSRAAVTRLKSITAARKTFNQ